MHKRKGTSTPGVPTTLVPQLLTIDQVAAVLSVGRSTVYELINEDGLPYVLVKGSVPIETYQNTSGVKKPRPKRGTPEK